MGRNDHVVGRRPVAARAACDSGRRGLRGVVRGLPLGSGAKALLLKCDGAFRLFVMPADRRLQSKRLRAALGVRDVRSATAEELLALTGLLPGSVPPFGEPVLPFPLFADEAMGVEHPEIAFNAGSLTQSIIMSAAEWAAAAKPQRLSFAAPEAMGDR